MYSFLRRKDSATIKKDRAKGEASHSSVGSIRKQFFRSQLVLIITLALILGLAGSLINLNFETEKRDQNLRNVAETIAQSPLLINIQDETWHTFLIFALITLVAIVIELIISSQISRRIKRRLLGYEPDMFTAMYKMRDNILETLQFAIKIYRSMLLW